MNIITGTLASIIIKVGYANTTDEKTFALHKSFFEQYAGCKPEVIEALSYEIVNSLKDLCDGYYESIVYDRADGYFKGKLKDDFSIDRIFAVPVANTIQPTRPKRLYEIEDERSEEYTNRQNLVWDRIESMLLMQPDLRELGDEPITVEITDEMYKSHDTDIREVNILFEHILLSASDMMNVYFTKAYLSDEKLGFTMKPKHVYICLFSNGMSHYYYSYDKAYDDYITSPGIDAIFDEDGCMLKCKDPHLMDDYVEADTIHITNNDMHDCGGIN